MKQFVEILLRSSLLVQALFFAGVLLTCQLIENAAALWTPQNRWKHAWLNFGFLLTNIPVQVAYGFAFALVMRWTAAHHVGLVYQLSFIRNHAIIFILIFVALDLGEYIYHVTMHKVKRLWMFHAVHHSDTFIDVSTTVREHPGENAIRTGFTLLWIILTGAPLWIFFFRQLIQTASTIFAHVNYRLPDTIDKYASFIFITPNLHHVHHHYRQPYTDCNYGDVLSIWDRLFGTFCRLSADQVVFGLDTFGEKDETGRYGALLKIPFGKYRNTKGGSPGA